MPLGGLFAFLLRRTWASVVAKEVQAPLYPANAFILEEELMKFHQIRRLIRLHEKAEWHSNEYKRLLRERRAQFKAFRHLQEAQRLYSQISRLIRDSTSVGANSNGNLPDSSSPMFKEAAMRFPVNPS